MTGPSDEGVEELLVRVHTDHLIRRQAETGSSSAHPDVQHGAAIRQRVASDRVRGGVVITIERLVGGTDEHGRTEEVRRLRRGCDQIARDRPATEHPSPSSIRVVRSHRAPRAAYDPGIFAVRGRDLSAARALTRQSRVALLEGRAPSDGGGGEQQEPAEEVDDSNTKSIGEQPADAERDE